MEEIWAILSNYISNVCCTLDKLKQNYGQCQYNHIGGPQHGIGTDVHITVCFPDKGAFEQFKDSLEVEGYCFIMEDTVLHSAIQFNPISHNDLHENHPAVRCHCLSK